MYDVFLIAEAEEVPGTVYLIRSFFVDNEKRGGFCCWLICEREAGDDLKYSNNSSFQLATSFLYHFFSSLNRTTYSGIGVGSAVDLFGRHKAAE